MRVALAAPNSSSSRGRRIRGTRTVFYFVTTDCNNFVADGTVHDKQDVTQVGRSRLWAVTFDDVTKIATDGTPTAETEMLLDGTEAGDTYDSATGAFFHHHRLKR